MSTLPESVLEIAAEIRAGQCTAAQVLERSLDRIDAADASIGAFEDTRADTARSMAATVDEQVAAGHDPGPLAGVPIAIKDCIAVKGEPMTCGSRILDGYVSPFDAAAIERLRQAGAVLLGRTRCDEFAMGSSTEHCASGTVSNPWSHDHVPGGSSGGSAAAVAAGFVPAALGTDTGGSIRQPAALCGITGFKPSQGRVPRWGQVSFAPSMDQIGPFARTSADCAAIMQVIAGEDARDTTSAAATMGSVDLDAPADLSHLRIGVPQEHLDEGNHPAVNDGIERACDAARSLGATIVPVRLETTDLGIACYYVLGPAEASSNLARFDGVRYGRRADDVASLDELYERSRTEGLGAEARRRIVLGTWVLSAGYYDAYYNRALKVRRLIHDEYAARFSEVDLLLGATTPAPAFKLGSMSDPMSMYLCDRYTVTANIAGICGCSIPFGTADVDGTSLPVGVQLLGPLLGDHVVLQCAHALQQTTDHHLQRPPAGLNQN
ncbi:MAG: Asp-tRNA(Asn)/Glu-tRNA(Gln) amidotransferase subunit GatA [Phycisphaerales bacterium]|nr:Asp-tRNA(Asn)/Glu-tRNA(Gln) amidotransferase subunit GatA [Phycisphaerales bacterium]